MQSSWRGEAIKQNVHAAVTGLSRSTHDLAHWNSTGIAGFAERAKSYPIPNGKSVHGRAFASLTICEL